MTSVQKMSGLRILNSIEKIMTNESGNLETLLNYFPSGTAEGERSLLDRVFIYADEFSKLISPLPGNPVLLVGDKGSGKSALIDFSYRLISSQGTPCVSLTSFDIDTSKIQNNASTGDMVRILYDTLLISIAKKLSEESTGWFVKDYANLYHAATNSGARAPDLPGKIGKFISEASKSITKVDLNAAFPYLLQSTREEVESSAKRIVGKRSFYLFIDDTDQITSPEERTHLNRVWALILAARRIAEKIPELKCIISLRSEVWSRLQRDSSGQRDQYDHFRSLVVKMKKDKEHVKKILLRRFSLAANDIGVGADFYEIFFDRRSARAPQSKELRSWEDLISVRSRDRPRDAIQLVAGLARHAIAKKQSKIDQSVFQEVMPEFSREISEEFAREVVRECPEALEILKSFSEADFDHTGFTLGADAALNHFKILPSRFGIHLFGKTLQQGVEQDAFELWHFFYSCGVLNARVSDATMKDGFRHLSIDIDRFVVSKIRWNEMQKILWEINTVYRDYLMQLHENASKYTGLPYKRPAKKPRDR